MTLGDDQDSHGHDQADPYSEGHADSPAPAAVADDEEDDDDDDATAAYDDLHDHDDDDVDDANDDDDDDVELYYSDRQVAPVSNSKPSNE